MTNNSSSINTQLANQVNDNERTLAQQQFDLDKTKIEQGWVGKIWGGTSNNKINIAALIILIALFFAIIYSFFVEKDAAFTAKDCWTTVAPIITLALGYIFGDKRTNKNEH